MHQARSFAETPRDALDLRRQMLSWWTNLNDTQAEWFQQMYPLPPGIEEGTSEHREILAGAIGRERHVLAHGELFLVSDEMTEVARAAALTLPSFILEKEDFPSENGLMLFHHSPAEDRRSADGETSDIVAASWWWGFHQGKPGVLFQWYEDRDGGQLPPSVPPEKHRAVREANARVFARLVPQAWTLIPLGEDFSTATRAPALTSVVAALLLMQQPLAAREQVRLLPMDRKRAARAGVQDTGVTVVKLRHVKTAASGSEVRPREYRHRWIVRGHWRNQWLPSRGVHRPTWINAHIKGPEDAPVKVTERVNVWAR